MKWGSAFGRARKPGIMFFEPFSEIRSVADVKVSVFQALQDVHKKHNSKLVLVWGLSARPPLPQEYPEVHDVHFGVLVDVGLGFGGLSPSGEKNTEVHDVYFAVGVEVRGTCGPAASAPAAIDECSHVPCARWPGGECGVGPGRSLKHRCSIRRSQCRALAESGRAGLERKVIPSQVYELGILSADLSCLTLWRTGAEPQVVAA